MTTKTKARAKKPAMRVARKRVALRKAKPSKTSSRRAPAAAGSGQTLKIRMYNVGFGDAFLLFVPTAAGEKRILFDCGSIAAGPRSIAQVARQIIGDCTTNGKARIDVVVCTHRHRDHVSGFASPDWDAVEVAEVWMPWTEDPRDPVARRILRKQAGLAAALAESPGLTNAGLMGMAGNAGAKVPETLSAAETLTLNALSNETAMTMLHAGFTGAPGRRFLPELDHDDKIIRTFTTPALPGVKVHVLGPSRKEDVITDMDPPRGASYLRMREEVGRGPGRECRPVEAEFEYQLGPGVIPSEFLKYFLPTDIEDVGMEGTVGDLAAAVALDKAVNGTSLMLVLEIRGKCLLFPGDAQWGTWNAAMQDEEWQGILSRTAFYKIGHHGSHNATPKDFVENHIDEHAIAMASTKVRSIWPNIPKRPLLDALTRKKVKYARSDEEAAAQSPVFATQAGNYIETEIAL
jgi:beta-lactamase superfamily II metal-dependent hydrolase